LETIGQKRTRDRVYREIWQEAYGDIPKDERGISFDIHHIDGDHTNNALENLQAVSVAEHYAIHYKQEDWHEASLIAKRLFISLDEWKELKSKATTQQWANRSSEERAKVIEKGIKAQTPEQRSEKARKGRETLKRSGKLAGVGEKIAAALAKVDTSASAKRGWVTRKANKLLKEQQNGN
jgi:hypothetical protein